MDCCHIAGLGGNLLELYLCGPDQAELPQTMSRMGNVETDDIRTTLGLLLGY